MRLAQIILDSATPYDRRLQQLDAVALREAFTIAGSWREAEIAHVYGRIAPGDLTEIDIPYVASNMPRRRRLAFRQTPPPAAVISAIRDDPSGAQYVPEAVEEEWFDAGDARPSDRAAATPRVIGSLGRPPVMPFIEQTMARVDRFRDDVVWHIFEHVPPPVEVAALDAWIDPATDDLDDGGLVGEALAACVPVVASRIPINLQRLDRGYAGLLVPANDPNEMTHAILAALFKPEVARAKSDAARQTRSKFRARHRARILAQLYGNLSG